MITTGSCQLTRQETTFLVIVQLDWNLRGPNPVISRSQVWDAKSGARIPVSQTELAIIATHFPPLIARPHEPRA